MIIREYVKKRGVVYERHWLIQFQWKRRDKQAFKTGRMPKIKKLIEEHVCANSVVLRRFGC